MVNMYKDGVKCVADETQVDTMIAGGWSLTPKLKPVPKPANNPAPAAPTQAPAAKAATQPAKAKAVKAPVMPPKKAVK